MCCECDPGIRSGVHFHSGCSCFVVQRLTGVSRAGSGAVSVRRGAEPQSSRRSNFDYSIAGEMRIERIDRPERPSFKIGSQPLQRETNAADEICVARV